MKSGWGDFQTPRAFADKIITSLWKNHRPQILIEPTCGEGNFIFSAVSNIPSITKIIAVDLNGKYITNVKSRLDHDYQNISADVFQADVFTFDWSKYKSEKLILIIGNPPWVTNTNLTKWQSTNIPNKNNSKKRTVDALLGSSNFDISETIMWEVLKIFKNCNILFCMICKWQVAKKIFRKTMNKEFSGFFKYYKIDSKAVFNVNVNAGLLTFVTGETSKNMEIYASLDDQISESSLTMIDDLLVTNSEFYSKNKNLFKTSKFRWRSGVKHDLSKILELETRDGSLRNKFDEIVDIEEDFIFPLMKSSDVYNDRKPSKCIILTQNKLNEVTEIKFSQNPKLAKYFLKYKDHFNNRKSRIYKNVPNYSVFGIGPYSFKKWKIAISSMYKKIKFTFVEPYHDKPVLFDDTVYFLSFDEEKHARKIFNILSSNVYKEALESIICWEDQRPVKIKLLNRLVIN